LFPQPCCAWEHSSYLSVLDGVSFCLPLIYDSSSKCGKVISKGRYDEALAVVHKLHGSDYNEEWVIREFEEMKSQITYEEQSQSHDFSELWKTKPMRCECPCAM